MRIRLARRLLAIGGVFILGSSMAACSGDSGSSSSGTSAKKDTATVALRTPNWILPISAPGFTQGENAIFGEAMYRSLYSYQLDGTAQFNINPTRSMAEPPVVSDGGKTLTITLKDNKWSDGQ